MKRTFLLLTTALAVGCGGGGSAVDAEGEPTQDAGLDASSDAAVDAGSGDGCAPPQHDPQPELCSGLPPPGVRRDEWIVQVPPAPQNPVTGAETPSELNRVRVLRYRRDPPIAEVEAVIAFIPGGWAGATSLDPLARHIVADATGPVEVWAFDRRENLLEDLRGIDAAETAHDPFVAEAYYFEGAEIDGHVYTPIPDREALGYMSEWGLVTFMADLRTVLNAVPQDRRATNLFLAGHSLGGQLSSIAAAWDIGGAALASELAGIILIDGSVCGVGLDRDAYHDGVTEESPGYPPIAGVDALRDGTGSPITDMMGADEGLLLSLEITAMRAYYDPAAVRCDDRLASGLAALYGFSAWMTNAALLGLLFDDDYSPFCSWGADVGDAAGGSFQTIDMPIFESPFQAPGDPTAVYYWIDSPGEISCLPTLARSLFAGPSNFLEWAFPTRLDLDERAVEDLRVSTAGGDYRYDEEGLLVTRAAKIDAPVLAIGANNRWLDDARIYFEPFRRVIAPVARNGATRDEEAGFRLVIFENWTHLDLVVSDRPEPAAAIIYFVKENHQGTVSLAGVGGP